MRKKLQVPRPAWRDIYSTSCADSVSRSLHVVKIFCNTHLPMITKKIRQDCKLHNWSSWQFAKHPKNIQRRQAKNLKGMKMHMAKRLNDSCSCVLCLGKTLDRWSSEGCQWLTSLYSSSSFSRASGNFDEHHFCSANMLSATTY